MQKTIGIMLASLLALGMAPAAHSEKPPVDLNTAVSNPSLVKAMERVVREDSDAAQEALVAQLQKANYLAIVLKDGLKTSPVKKSKKSKETNRTKQQTIEKGSSLQVLSAQKDGKEYLLLFTDWDAIKAYTTVDVTGWVLPAKDAWNFVLQGKIYEGVLINPAHNALPLDRPVLESFQKSASK